MQKIKVTGAIAELDGDEMTRIIWKMIKDKLIHPYLDVTLDYFDLGIENRDKTADQVTIDAANAIKKHGVGVKCATITPDEARVKEFGLKEMWKIAQRHHPQHPGRRHFPRAHHRQERAAPRAGLDQAHRHRPPCLRRPVQGHRLQVPGQGQAHHQIRGRGRQASSRRKCSRRPAAGVAMAMYNLDDSIREFAQASFNYGLNRNYSVYLSTKNTILKAYDGRFKDLFQEVFDAEFKDEFAKRKIVYEHRLIDDMVASAMKWSGGYVWACKNYDGDVQSDTVAQGFGSLGLMTSVLMTPDGKTVEAEAAHGTVTRHYREHQKGKDTSTNSIASDLRLDARADPSRQARRQRRAGQVRGDAREGVRRHGRSGLHDQGSGAAGRVRTRSG